MGLSPSWDVCGDTDCGHSRVMHPGNHECAMSGCKCEKFQEKES